MPTSPTGDAPAWVRNVLFSAAIYNLAWGAAIIFAPLALFAWAGMEAPRYPQIWQCVGMIVGVYGVGYWIAARDPFRHWPIVLVGLIGKVLGPLGFLKAAWTGALPWKWGATIITNDLIWWLPFASILYLAFRNNTNTASGVPALNLFDAVRGPRSHRNASLLEISSKSPTLVVFLRHAGCTFCHESLAMLEGLRGEIRRLGVELAIVHMGDPMDGTVMLQKSDLHNVHHFSDPHCQLYRAFGLRRGTFAELFAPRVIKSGFRAMINGHGLGMLAGDGFRLPGASVLVEGKIVAAYHATSADDHCDYLRLLREAGATLPSDPQTNHAEMADGIRSVAQHA